MSVSALSRTENGQRDLTFSEVLALAEALRVTPDVLRDFAETFERAGALASREALDQHASDLNELQKLACEAAIEARSLSGQ
jgi:transcriptional regulator with XRE-family HTH domain